MKCSARMIGVTYEVLRANVKRPAGLLLSYPRVAVDLVIYQAGIRIILTDISNVMHHERFRQIVEPDKFEVRSVLSLPIRDSDFKVIGVVQLMNKLNEKPFSDSDVNIVEVRT